MKEEVSMDCCKLEQNRKTLPVLQELINQKNALIRAISGCVDAKEKSLLQAEYIEIQNQIMGVGKAAS